MGKKYKRYKNFLEKFLDSNAGKRFFNIAYSVGAAIVIIGAMAKILHWPFGDLMLMVGMITEAFVFLISAFEKPAKEYKWEEVYPVLSENEDFIPKTERESQQNDAEATSPAIQSTSIPSSQANRGNNGKQSTQYVQQSGGGRTGRETESATVIIGGKNIATEESQPTTLSESKTVSGGSLSGNITIVNGGGGNPNNASSGSISDTGLGQMVEMTENLEKFAKVTESLSKISDALQVIIGNSEGLDKNTQGFVSQMENLNRNIAGLNTIYEIQLKGVSGQINTIEHINAGLDRIKKLYDGSLADSSIFKNETEKMAQQLAELNHVYARLLQAMTTNMGGAGFHPNLGNNSSSQQP